LWKALYVIIKVPNIFQIYFTPLEVTFSNISAIYSTLLICNHMSWLIQHFLLIISEHIFVTINRHENTLMNFKGPPPFFPQKSNAIDRSEALHSVNTSHRQYPSCIFQVFLTSVYHAALLCSLFSIICILIVFLMRPPLAHNVNPV